LAALAEKPIPGVPGWEGMGQPTPLATGSHAIHDGIEPFPAVVGRRIPFPAFTRQQNPDVYPLVIGAIGWIGFSLVHILILHLVSFPKQALKTNLPLRYAPAYIFSPVR
jgi:hypothetical protein